MAFASLWDVWKDKDEHWLQSFAIVTTEANDSTARMTEIEKAAFTAFRLSATTNDTGEVVGLAVHLGERLWRDGFRQIWRDDYGAPAGSGTAAALWSEPDGKRRERVWKTVDPLSTTLERGTVRIMSAGPKEAARKLRAKYRSPRWTTRSRGSAGTRKKASP